MISKRIQPNRNGKISYKDKKSTSNLINYVANKTIENMTNYVADKTAKVWYINLPQDRDLAIGKMQNTQAMNTSTTASKIYHYIVSFNHGEQDRKSTRLNSSH